MQKWEYKVVRVVGRNAEAELNELGSEGWEVVAGSSDEVYLKRPIP